MPDDRGRVVPSMIGMLHDVDVSTVTPMDGALLVWSDAVQKWVVQNPPVPPTFGSILDAVPGADATIPIGGQSYSNSFTTTAGRLLFVCVSTNVGVSP